MVLLNVNIKYYPTGFDFYESSLGKVFIYTFSHSKNYKFKSIFRNIEKHAKKKSANIKGDITIYIYIYIYIYI